MRDNMNNNSIREKKFFIIILLNIFFTISLIHPYGLPRTPKPQIPNQIDIVNLQINNSGRMLDVNPNEKIKISFDYSVFGIENNYSNINEKLNKQFVIGFIRKNMFSNAKIIGQINVTKLNDKIDDQQDSDKIDDWQYKQSYSNRTHIVLDKKCFYNEKQSNNVNDKQHTLKLTAPSVKGEYYLVVSQHFLFDCREAEEAFLNNNFTYNYQRFGLTQKKYSNFDAYMGLDNISSMNNMKDNIGLSVGGAKDINNFRENIKNDFLPLPTDISYEGLFYDYYFDTNMQDECSKLFCPSYTFAAIKDPFSGNDEYYLSVGLNSGIKKSDFKRKKLNLVIVLDISGSMSSSFNEYYYDNRGNKIKNNDWAEDKVKSKMQIANESIVALLEHLNDDDRFGMVLFESKSHLAKPLREVGKTDMEAIKNHIMEIYQKGGTNMSSGINRGTELFDELQNINPDEYENRIIFLTDAMPNKGNTRSSDLFNTMENNAKNGIYSTIIGIGVDFNTELIEEIVDVKGSNYYSVHSSQQFKERLDDEFEYMVTPLVFDLQLSLSATGYEIEQVYGSPSADKSTGDILYVNTLFPSKSVNGKNKGGLILVKLRKTSEYGTLSLRTSYEDRSGNFDGQTKTITFNSTEYTSTGIMKGILLTQYVNLLKNWMIDERLKEYNPRYDIYGLCKPTIELETSKWERNSIKLTVSKEYKNIFNNFRIYFKNMIKEVNDKSLEKEVEVLDKLITKAKSIG